METESGGKTDQEKIDISNLPSYQQVTSELGEETRKQGSDSEIVKSLNKQRLRLIEAAKQRGLLRDIKTHVEQIQDAWGSNFDESIEQVATLNPQRFEDQADAQGKLDPKLSGIISDWHEGALLNMQIARENAKENPDPDKIHEWQEQLSVVGWGTPRPDLQKMAKEEKAGEEEQKGFKQLVEVLQQLLRGRSGEEINPEDREDSMRNLYELQYGSYKILVDYISKRLHVNPEQFDQTLPAWYRNMDKETQNMLRTMLHINYLAASKQMAAAGNLDAWAEVGGLRIDRQGLKTMFENMPGFREAMATMINEVFISGADHFILSGDTISYKKDEKGAYVVDKEGKRVVETQGSGGYGLIGDTKKLEAYRNGLVIRLTTHLESEEAYGRIDSKWGKDITARDLALAAVSAVDNFFFSCGVYDSADEMRKLALGENSLVSEAVRSFMRPFDKAYDSWLKEKSPDDKSVGRIKKTFGGDLGNWMRVNCLIFGKDYEDKIIKDEIRYLPKRFFFSLPDILIFKKDVNNAEKTLSEVLLKTEKKKINDDLCDFDGQINLEDLEDDDLLSRYDFIRGKAIKIYKHLTASKPDDRLDIRGVLENLDTLRGNRVLRKTFLDDGFLPVLYAFAIAREKGLVYGTQNLILDLGKQNIAYDDIVSNALNDGRLWEGMQASFKEGLYSTLCARNMNTLGETILSFIPVLSTIRRWRTEGARERERQRAITRASTEDAINLLGGKVVI